MKIVIDTDQKISRQDTYTILDEFAPSKTFDAAKFAGKIKWDEEPLEYQKRLRNEWN